MLYFTLCFFFHILFYIMIVFTYMFFCAIWIAFHPRCINDPRPAGMEKEAFFSAFLLPGAAAAAADAARAGGVQAD